MLETMLEAVMLGAVMLEALARRWLGSNSTPPARSSLRPQYSVAIFVHPRLTSPLLVTHEGHPPHTSPLLVTPHSSLSPLALLSKLLAHPRQTSPLLVRLLFVPENLTYPHQTAGPVP